MSLTLKKMYYSMPSNQTTLKFLFLFQIFDDEEFARVKGHFGPINSVMFHPDGASYASGGEDGYVRINVFDQPYFDFSFEC